MNEQDSGRALNTTWRGGARAEVALTNGLDLLAGWQHESCELSGSALIDSPFLQSITFGGATPGDVKTQSAPHGPRERSSTPGSTPSRAATARTSTMTPRFANTPKTSR